MLIRTLVACAAATVVSLAGCGGEEPVDTPIMISLSSGPDHLDPALSAQISGLESLWLVYTPLLTYRHAEGEKGAELIAGLASDLPQVSADGLTYSLTLRKDLTYSDGSVVRAGDFEHAIARTLYLGSAGARFYAPIVGAPEFRLADDPEADIDGIEADPETGEITITLSRPDPAFADALALPSAAPLPARTPFRDLSATPPPGVGPYEITATDTDGGFVLERSTSFAGLDIPDIPTGNIAEITARVVPGTLRQAEDVLDGKLDYMQDPPPAGLRPTILEQASDRFAEHPTPSTSYFFFDLGQAPFADPLVREAANRAIDRAALASELGETQPGCALLAPGVPGYDEALDTTECPYGNPAEPPDLPAARALVEQAGAAGARVIVAAGGDPDARAATRAYAAGLEAIGLRARVERCASCAQTGVGTLAPEFPRALGFFDELGLADPLVVSELARMRESSEVNVDAESDADAWRALDTYTVSPPQSYEAPFGHRTVATFFSERMDPKSAIVHPVYGNDYSSWQLKEGE